ncbi:MULTISPECIES: hypothetical protein [Bradyrhizobium]|uniref:Uncharacterized protein n=1 Tax=Bradyrhizobium elkanii TaxID=29448 RepID=A0A8I2C3Z4_BRAEL|nr:hypothetical protein [Bradyrhizobium elkanii]MBP1294129.1 hypothetical protein [Bradyrhizobium elkanii]
MRTVLIDPSAKKVDVVDLPSLRSATIKYFSEKPSPVLRLPQGDVVLAVKSAGGNAFVLGGSRPVGGVGLIVGCALGAGERASAHADLFLVTQMVRWTSIEDKMTETQLRVRAIEIDPERKSIEEFSIAPTMLAVQHRLGAEISFCYHVPGGDVVLGCGAASGLHEWRKDEASFRGRCIVIGRDSRKRFADVATSLARLKEDVSFR